ncbi:hypothetical protein CHUAL_004224 [Chamberlinius hualienensis]
MRRRSFSAHKDGGCQRRCNCTAAEFSQICMKLSQFTDKLGHTMLLKEEVFFWFRHLDAASRLSLLHGLLHLCHPVELRFVGNCLEDLCKKDYITLKDREIKSNNGTELQKLNDLKDDAVRTQLILACALLQASNRVCATTIFNTLLANLPLNYDENVNEKTSRIINEIILLMNMVIMHPAFNYEQKSTIELHLKQFQVNCSIQRNTNIVSGNESEYANRQLFYNHNQVSGVVPSTVHPPQTLCHYICDPPPSTVETSYPTTTCCSLASSSESTSSSSRGSTCSAKSFANSPKAQIKTLELKNFQSKKKTTKNPKTPIEYRILVTWSNGEVTEICKTHQDLVNFHQQLISFQDEPGHKERYIPYFLGPKANVGNKNDDPTDEGMGKMADYLKQLMVKVPHHLLDSELVTKFFRGAMYTNCESGIECSASSSSSSSSSSSASLPANSPPPVTSTCSTETVDNVDQKMKSLSIHNYAAETPKTYQPVISRASPEDRLLEQVFFKECMVKDLEDLLKKFDKKELLNLSEADLLKEGFDGKKAKQIIGRLETYKSQLPNGVACFEGVNYTAGDVVLQSPTVHPVQNHIFMPEANMDFLINYSMAPISFLDIDRSAAHTPTDVCNGDRVDSPHIIGHNQKNFETSNSNLSRQSMNGSRLAQQPRVNNKNRTGNRRGSIKEIGKSNSISGESSDVPVSSPNTLSDVDAVDFSHNIGKVIPSFTATTSVTYSVSQQHHHHHQQQQQQMHLTNVIPRLPVRPATLTNNHLCPCSRSTGGPPTMPPPPLPPMSYTFMPLMGSVYAGFTPQPPPPPPQAANQTSYIQATHATNGYVPTNYYTPLQSPDCMSSEVMTNRFPPTASPSAVVTQPPPPPGMMSRTNVQHTSPVPGFLTGPTPNVGFHGNQISVLPVATQLSLSGGIHPTYVISNPNVRLKPSCYNCGHCGHHGAECNETTIEEVNRANQFRLSYQPDDLDVCD